MKFFGTFVLTLLIAQLGLAEVARPLRCIQGKPENSELYLSMFYSQKLKGLYSAYQKSLEPTPTTPPKPTLSERILCFFDRNVHKSPVRLGPVEKLIENLKEIQAAAKLPSITPECIQASLKRGNATSGYTCDHDQAAPRSIGSPGPYGPCITEDMVLYLTWATNKAIACLNDPRKPLDPLLIFKKINQETGFHFFQAYNGGVGLTQVTSPALAQISQNTKYIEKVLESRKPECQPFKEALKRKVTTTHQWCSLIEPSEGLARNLIYGISYFIHLRDDNQLKVLNEGLQKLDIESADYYNYATLASYGREANRVQKKMVEAARKSPRNFNGFLKAATEKSEYIKEIDRAYRNLLNDNSLTDEQCVRHH